MAQLAAQKNLGSTLIELFRANKELVAAFPILANPPRIKRVRRCGGCGGNPVQSMLSVDYEKIKRSLVKANTEQRRMLRQAAGAKQLRVTYLDEQKRSRTVVL